ncbi:MAG: PAS domain S-box protein [bacterium]
MTLNPEETIRRLQEELAQLRAELDDCRRRQTRERHALEDDRQQVGEALAQQALRQSEQRFRAIVESSPMGMHMYRLEDGRLLFDGANPAADRILGLDHRQLVGKTIEEAFPALKGTPIPALYRDACETGAIFEDEQVSYRYGQIAGTFQVHAFQTEPGRMAAIFQDVTDRLRVESERLRLLAILESTSDLVATVTPDARFTYMNQAGMDLLGWKRDQVPNKSLIDAHPPASVRILTREGIPAAVTHGLWSGNTVLLTGDGRDLEVSQVIMAHHSSSGALEFLSTIVRDVSHIRRAEHVLRIQRDLGVNLGSCDDLDAVLRVCLDASIELAGMDCGCVYLVDDNTGALVLGAHRGFSDSYVESIRRIEAGSQRSRLVMEGRPVFSHNDLIGVSADDTADQRLRALAVIPISHDARVVACLTLASHHRDDTPEMRQRAATAITSLIGEAIARKRAESALRKSEMTYRTLVNTLPDAVTMSDLLGSVTYASDQSLALHGYGNASEVIGKDGFSLIAPEDRARAAETIQDTLERGVTRDIELRLLRRDGTGFDGEVSTSVIRDRRGQPEAFVTIARNIDERKRAAAELLELEQQLHQSQKMEAIGRLAGGVAHDFNNLLAAILVTCELMEDEVAAGSQLRDDLDQIVATANKGAALVRQLLAFSGRKAAHKALLNLNETVEGMHKLLRRLIGENVSLDLELALNLGAVEADQGQLEHVLINLVVNAMEAMPKGGSLKITTCDLSPDESGDFAPERQVGTAYVVLTVRDTGIGMDVETQSRVFEPFFTTKEGVKGTGLGLSIVYSVARQCGGFVQVRSAPGEGSTFQFCLPRRDPAELSAARARKSAAGKTAGGTETILVVEDDPVLLRQTARVLKQYGFDVLEASDGRSALRLVESYPDPIHLLLTDVIMPDLSGMEIAERLCHAQRSLKVLFMSGHIDPTLLRYAAPDSHTSFLPKPFDAEELVNKVRQVLDSMSADSNP